jgi:hypothetical protein
VLRYKIIVVFGAEPVDHLEHVCMLNLRQNNDLVVDVIQLAGCVWFSFQLLHCKLLALLPHQENLRIFSSSNHFTFNVTLCQLNFLHFQML